jgi:hypothetical protein
MKSLIITAIFVVLGLQTAHAADGSLSCQYKGQAAGESATFTFNDDMVGTGTSSEIMKDGSVMEMPLSASFGLGDKDGYLAVVITWSSLFDTMTSALPFKEDGGSVSAPAYSINAFGADGPKAALKGTLTCTFSNDLLHTLQQRH